MRCRGPAPLLTLPSKPGRVAHSAKIRDIVPPASLSTADGTGQTSSTKRVEFTDAKNIAPARQSVGNREIFHDRRLRDWFCWNSFGKLESGRSSVRSACFPARATQPTDGFIR